MGARDVAHTFRSANHGSRIIDTVQEHVFQSRRARKVDRYNSSLRSARVRMINTVSIYVTANETARSHKIGECFRCLGYLNDCISREPAANTRIVSKITRQSACRIGNTVYLRLDGTREIELAQFSIFQDDP